MAHILHSDSRCGAHITSRIRVVAQIFHLDLCYGAHFSLGFPLCGTFFIRILVVAHIFPSDPSCGARVSLGFPLWVTFSIRISVVARIFH